MSNDVHFLDDKAIAFGTDSGDPVVVTLKTSLSQYYGTDPGVARFELLLWALIKATRDVSTQLEKMAESSGDQAAAVREQTAQMQSNIDDARSNAPTPESVLQLVTKEFPDIMRAISGASGLDMATLLGGKPTVTRPNGGD